jgi:HEAT repeat protein
MLRTLLGLACLALTCFLPGPRPAEAEEGPIVTAQLALEPATLGSVSPGLVPWKGDPPAGVEPLPDLRAPRYARIRMADAPKGLLLALDISAENPRLWVDHDFDGDLRDETQHGLVRSGNIWRRTETILAPYESESEPVPVPLMFTYLPGVAEDHVTVYARIHRQGTVVLGGRLRKIALTDHSFDAAFDDEARDELYVDLDADGRFQVSGDGPERVRPGTPFRLGDEGWTAHFVSRSGHALEFRRTKTAPPPSPRAWQDTSVQTAGLARREPTESWEVLRARFDEEKQKPYIQRFQTVQSLGDLGTDESLSFLLRVADKDDDTNVRSAALRALGNPAYVKSGGPRILARARKASGVEASALAQALHQMGHPERERAYLDMLDGADTSAISAAARYLAWMESEEGRKRILSLVKDHGTDNVRYTVYTNGARNLRGGPPLDLVLAASVDKYAPLQSQAIRDLQILGHPSAGKRALELAEMRPVQVTVGEAVAEVLGMRGDGKAVAAMMAMLEDPQLPANVRKSIVEQLRMLRADGAIAAMVKGLKHKEAAVRAVAAEVLAGIQRLDVTKALLARVRREKDPVVLALMLEALGDHGDPAALPTLLKQAGKRRHDAPRAAAIRGLARLGFHHPKVRALLLDLLSSRDEESRILALDAAAASGDESVVPDVVPNLAHEVWQVRLAAVQALDRLRPRAAIAPLIARLEVEEAERVRDAIAGALFRMTGMNLYDDGAIWARWWAEHEQGFTVPEAIPTLPEQHVGGTQAGFYGIPIKSERVVFVIDQSGSMSAAGLQRNDDEAEDLNRLDVAIREVLGAVAKLKNRAYVNVILFHTTIHPWKPALQRLNAANRGTLERHLRSKSPTGGTNLYDGLELALRTPDVDTIFLLSDGFPGSGKYVATADILRAVRRENQTRRIAIHCISIGMDSDLMQRIAAENAGRYVRR